MTWSFSPMQEPFEKYYERRRAHEMLAGGMNPTRAARILGRSEKFVKSWFRRGRAGVGFFDRRRAGRPKRVPLDLSKVEKRLLKRKRRGSSKLVAAELRTKYGVNISDRTVRRDAHRLGLKYRIRKIKPRLNERDIANRLRFAKARRPSGFWRQVWWTDEKAFTLHNDPRGQWVEVSDEVEPREKDLVESAVRVWGGISGYGKTKIFRIPPYWTALEYRDHLFKKALPSIEEVSTGEFVFEQDGDGAHQGKVVLNFLADRGVHVLEGLPAHSPDIPPIENIWAELVRRLENRKVKTLDGLWIAIKEEWDNINQERLMKYIDSVPIRLQEIIALRGRNTKH